MTPNSMIAQAIQRERGRVGLSLSALATKAGLAKSTLSQLEAGQGNPSVETLWSIAVALQIPFSFLFETSQPETSLIRADEGVKLDSSVASLSTTVLSNCPPNSRRDLYRLDIAEKSIRISEPHPPGTIEHAFVASGIVKLGPLDSLKTLNAGDYYRYPADTKHSYETLTETSNLMVIMESPR